MFSAGGERYVMPSTKTLSSDFADSKRSAAAEVQIAARLVLVLDSHAL